MTPFYRKMTKENITLETINLYQEMKSAKLCNGSNKVVPFVRKLFQLVGKKVLPFYAFLIPLIFFSVWGLVLEVCYTTELV